MGASGGGIGEGPRACPFVALEFDRDRRSDEPDYRHRCYAEPTPAPRAIAHQEAYCLSPNFSACPIFQDWARRAAARPVSGPEAAAEAVAAAAAAATADEAGAVDEAEPSEEAEPSGDAEPELEAEEVNGEAALAAGDAEDSAGPEQLAAFSAPADSETPVPPPRAEWADDQAADESALADWEAEGAPESHDETESDVAPVPPFLAGRPEPPPSASPGPAPKASKVKREDVVPSWEIDGRYGAEPPASQPRDRFGGLITALAVLLILGLGVAGVIYLPGLLAGGGPPGSTPTSSIGFPTGAPPTASGSLPASEAPTLAPTPTPTTVQPTATPGPQASPIAYEIERGDSLRRIARRFGVDVADILALNPQITDPNHIEVGQVILIPQPAEP